jgi:hypothetical protein
MSSSVIKGIQMLRGPRSVQSAMCYPCMVLVIACLLLSCRSQGNFEGSSAPLISAASQSPRRLELALYNSMMVHTSSITIFADGTVVRNRWGTVEVFWSTPESVSTLINSFEKLGFFDLRRDMIFGELENNARWSGFGVIDASTYSLTAENGHRTNTVTVPAAEVYAHEFPTVKSLKQYIDCARLITSNYWNR